MATLGLDELMIVNPGPPEGAALFLGQDGVFYRTDRLQGLERFFLGEDGSLYRVQGVGLAGLDEGKERQRCGCKPSSGFGRYFLGADGMLYEAVEY
jgi:hypothetical protein